MKDKWAIYRKECPECGSHNIESLNRYRYTNYKKKEQRKYKCKECNCEWWE